MHFWSVFERSADHSEIESNRKNNNNSNNPAAAATTTTTTKAAATTTTTTTTTTYLNPLRNRHVRSSSSIRAPLILLLLYGQRCQEFNELQMTTEGAEALYNADQLKAGNFRQVKGCWGLEFLLKVGGFLLDVS